MPDEATACLDEDVAVALVQGGLAAAEKAEAQSHVDRCDECRTLIAALVQMSSVRRSSADSDVTTVPTEIRAWLQRIAR